MVHQTQLLWKQTVYARDAQGNTMMVYDTELEDAPGADRYDAETKAKEAHLYGSSRLGLKKLDLNIATKRGTFTSGDKKEFSINGNYIAANTDYELARGQKIFELSDHLGNVNVTLTDHKFIDPSTGLFIAKVNSASEVYPFGMEKEERTYMSSDYRYGFNGAERDDEIKPDGKLFRFRFKKYI